MIKVGLIGVGGMGRTHFNCYKNNAQAQVTAICDVEERKLRGDWSSIGLNIDTSKSGLVDVSGLKTYGRFEELLADPDIDAVDICLPTSLHASMTIAALRAGKHVLCEKPMSLSSAECREMAQAARQAKRQLMIGHCLRFWPEYVQAHEMMQSGEFGQPLYASFHRSSATPLWSWDNWMADGRRSGGAVLDMHIHDADTALWWFGAPDSIRADGLIVDGLPLTVDATWRYKDGPVVALHGAWDNNGGPFRMAFKLVLERATILYDSSSKTFRLVQSGPQGEQSEDLAISGASAYQNEIDEFIDCVQQGRPLTRITPDDGRLAVEMVREEMRQIEAAQNGVAQNGVA